jgi:NAD+ kinase
LHIYSDRHRLLWGEGVQVLIVCKQDPRADPLARELTDRFRRNGVSTTVLIKDVSLYDCSKVDVVLVLGGDGTILRTARHFAWLNIPILGINLGKIGFLSSAEADQALATVDKVLRKEYLLDERLMLQVKVVRNEEPLLQASVLNDLVIRATVCHTTNINLRVDGKPCITCRGDGVICATPTGSTGYSLSAGGVVIDPSVSAMVVTQICPQLAFSRSLVLGANSELGFMLDSDRSTSLYLDGEEPLPLNKGDDIIVQRALVTAKIIQFEGVRQFTKLSRSGLKGGLDDFSRGYIASRTTETQLL